MKKLFKWLLRIVIGLVVLVLLAFGVIYLIYNEPLPEGKTGKEAEALAQKMMQAIDQTAWDSTRYVQWTFKGVHDFWWDKQEGLVEVRWSNNRVLLDHNAVKGQAFVDGKEVKDYSYIEKAFSFFINDAFWFNAPAQMMRSGIEKRAVDLENGEKGLLVTYKTGGVTPGDSYLWILDETGKPKRWKMWVSIIPIGGVEATWEDWTTLSTGAKVATNHDLSIISLPITNLKAGMTLEEMGKDKSPFANFSQTE